jgi:hypothetical protein
MNPNRLQQLLLLSSKEVGDYSYGSIKEVDYQTLVQLIGREVLTLQNRHGNIKPAKVCAYFGIEEEKQDA